MKRNSELNNYPIVNLNTSPSEILSSGILYTFCIQLEPKIRHTNYKKLCTNNKKRALNYTIIKKQEVQFSSKRDNIVIRTEKDKICHKAFILESQRI